MPHQIFAKAWHSWGGKKHRGVVPPSASNIASKTRRVASQSASQHTEPQKRAGTPAPPASSVVLDAEQQKFLVCCGIFLQQAKSLGQEVELRAAIEGRFFAEWSIAVDKSMASTVALVQKVPRSFLLRGDARLMTSFDRQFIANSTGSLCPPVRSPR